MDVKLTIKLNKQVIESAKFYAKNHQTSLSKMIESYLSHISKNERKKVKITPLIESLSGVISLPVEYDYKEEYIDFLNKKY